MFFSVKEPLKIAGKVYLPCICYPLPKMLEATITKLEAEEKAVIYKERVFFQNGKVIVPILEEAKTETKKVSKKETKTTLEKEAEEVGLPTELEGF